MVCLQVCIWTPWIPGVHGVQKSVSDPTGRELQMVLSFHVGAGNRTRAERAFNCWVISPAPRQRWRLGVMSYDCKPRRKKLKQRDFSWVWNKLALPTKALSHKNQKKKGGPSSHNCAGLPCALCNPLHTSYTHTHRHNNNNNNGKMSFKRGGLVLIYSLELWWRLTCHFSHAYGIISVCITPRTWISGLEISCQQCKQKCPNLSGQTRIHCLPRKVLLSTKMYSQKHCKRRDRNTRTPRQEKLNL